MSSALADILKRGAAVFAHDLRFVPGGGEPGGEGPLASPPDEPARLAWADGYARGIEEAEARAQATAAQEAMARGQIEGAFERMTEAEALRLEERLRETVLMLCEHTLAPLAIDHDALNHRIGKALALLRRAEDERVLRLHPEDLALLAGRLPDHLRTEPDPSLPRGGLRIETPDGGVEDGPEQWRRALAEALGL